MRYNRSVLKIYPAISNRHMADLIAGKKGMQNMGKAEENKQHKRIALLDAAFELFTDRGVNKTSIADISERAGIAKGTFYLYFKDKYDIRDKLTAHKSGIIFTKAMEALRESGLSEQSGGLDYFKKTFIFIADNIIRQFCEDKALLTFISKNLSWAIFKKALSVTSDNEAFDFRKVYYSLIEEASVSFAAPEIMLFMIVELISSTCYSSILFNDPTDIGSLKPHLFNAICHIIDSQLEPNT